jgi:hypothetical protein
MAGFWTARKESRATIFRGLRSSRCTPVRNQQSEFESDSIPVDVGVDVDVDELDVPLTLNMVAEDGTPRFSTVFPKTDLIGYQLSVNDIKEIDEFFSLNLIAPTCLLPKDIGLKYEPWLQLSVKDLS